jgi:hypothetical protein
MALVQNREILGKGLKFPFRIGGDSLSHDGPEISKYERHVVEGLWQSIMVPLKQKRGNRNFGSRLFELPFDELSKAPGLAKTFIQDTLEKEPRIKLLGSGVYTEKNTLKIWANIVFISTGNKANLVFPFYKEAVTDINKYQIQVEIQ